VDEIQSYFSVNLTSVMALNSAFLSSAKQHLSREGQIVVVNVSSLLALQPQVSLALYCSGKAARDMFFKVLALENTQTVKNHNR